jgi:hypothetical protein
MLVVKIIITPMVIVTSLKYLVYKFIIILPLYVVIPKNY